uniref:Uncharacterized protein n=1 Tax=Rhizophora mucronata TaxID=61149 RepID=A0A2P2JEQ5_RHIMU
MFSEEKDHANPSKNGCFNSRSGFSLLSAVIFLQIQQGDSQPNICTLQAAQLCPFSPANHNHNGKVPLHLHRILFCWLLSFPNQNPHFVHGMSKMTAEGIMFSKELLRARLEWKVQHIPTEKES